METLSGAVDLRRKTGIQVHGLLQARGYEKIDDDYKYLTKMPMNSVTDENVAAIIKEKESLEQDLTLR